MSCNFLPFLSFPKSVTEIRYILLELAFQTVTSCQACKDAERVIPFLYKSYFSLVIGD